MEIEEMLREGKRLEERLIQLKKSIRMLSRFYDCNIDLEKWEIQKKTELRTENLPFWNPES